MEEKNWLDLHMHSCISDDGENTPEELMDLCADAGLKVVALADHNFSKGVLEAENRAKQNGLQLIPAIEIDCQQRGHNLHLLAYGIDPKLPVFDQLGEELLQKELAASGQRMQNVQKLGIALDEEEVMSLSRTGVATGEAIAEAALADSRNDGNALLEPYRPGGAKAINAFVNFYWDYCAQGKPAYVPVKFIDLMEVISILNDMHAVPVLAHPYVNIGFDQDLLTQIIACGVKGVEVFSSYHDEKARQYYLEFVRENDLLMTLGSDFHGKTKPAIYLGEMECKWQQEIFEKLIALMQ